MAKGLSATSYVKLLGVPFSQGARSYFYEYRKIVVSSWHPSLLGIKFPLIPNCEGLVARLPVLKEAHETFGDKCTLFAFGKARIKEPQYD